GGIRQVSNGQRQRNTEATMSSVMRTLAQHWSQVISDAKKETPSDVVKQLAGYGTPYYDSDRAQTLWVKVRLMEAFPVSFAEIGDPSDPDSPLVYKTGLIPKGRRQYLPFYQRELLNKTAISSDYNGPSTESSACLLMALTKSRKGSTLAPDVLGSSTIRDSDGDGVPEIVDGWGTALAFFRFPAANWTDPTMNGFQQ